MAHEHVDVAPAAERAAEPVQLVAQRLRPGRVEHRARGTQDRPRPSHRHADAVHVLGIEVEPDAGVVAQDLGVLPLEHRAQPPDRVVGAVAPVRWCPRGRSARGSPRAGTPGRTRATSAGGVTGPPSCSTTSGSPWSRGSSRRQMPFPCSRRRESAAPTSSSRRSGQVVVRDLGSPVLGHGRMLTQKERGRGDTAPPAGAVASQGRGGGNASRFVCLVERSTPAASRC